MWVAIPYDDKHEVGYYNPDGMWVSIIKTEDISLAFQYVNYLNGGDGSEFPEKKTLNYDCHHGVDPAFTYGKN